jgi:hypothetical protein
VQHPRRVVRCVAQAGQRTERPPGERDEDHRGLVPEGPFRLLLRGISSQLPRYPIRRGFLQSQGRPAARAAGRPTGPRARHAAAPSRTGRPPRLRGEPRSLRSQHQIEPSSVPRLSSSRASLGSFLPGHPSRPRAPAPVAAPEFWRGNTGLLPVVHLASQGPGWGEWVSLRWQGRVATAVVAEAIEDVWVRADPMGPDAIISMP